MSENDNDSSRRNFLIGATTVVGSVGAAGVAVPFVKSWNPSAKAKSAGAAIKVNIGLLKPGAILGPFPEWRGQPIYIVRRSQETLKDIDKQDDRMADPNSDMASQQPAYAQNKYRSIKPEILVVLGICPHLGCAPKVRLELEPQPFEENWLGGFFCPCHGSKFDLAGRVYSGVPAPSNMEIPPHYYESDDVIVVGKEEVI